MAIVGDNEQARYQRENVAACGGDHQQDRYRILLSLSIVSTLTFDYGIAIDNDYSALLQPISLKYPAASYPPPRPAPIGE